MRMLLLTLLASCFATCSPDKKTEGWGKIEQGGNRDPGVHTLYDPKPVLELPYGRFEAFSKRNGLWTFKNIPYAAPPVGNLRWEKPAPPVPREDLSKGANPDAEPYQVWMDGMKVVEENPDADRFNRLTSTWLWKHKLDDAKLNGPSDEFYPGQFYGEHCLHLDIIVPEAALVESKKLPVVVFIQGEAFLAGSKEKMHPLFPLYDGYGLVDASEGEMIYVVFNYRVGAFGFMGGTTMENEGVPNVGLWDQRAVFQWVQDYISLVGGDASEVTAMGHSSGASSIMFHLTAEGGTLDPLFKYAIMLSPTYTPMWDRRGDIEDRFQRFAKFAGCESKGLECLRRKHAETLQLANQEVALAESEWRYPFGPVPDGKYIRNLPMLEWAKGNVWPIESVIMSHTSGETGGAVDPESKPEGWSEVYLQNLLPKEVAGLHWADDVLAAYPLKKDKKKNSSPDMLMYKNETQRLEEIILHMCFTCHTRWLIEALGEERVYLQYYDTFPFVHGSDLAPLFWQNPYMVPHGRRPMAEKKYLDRVNNAFFVRRYKEYLANFITRKGNPTRIYNSWPIFNERKGSFEAWGHPTLGTENNPDAVGNVLVSRAEALGVLRKHDWDPFDTEEIQNMPKSKCDAWRKVYALASKISNGNQTGVVVRRDT